MDIIGRNYISIPSRRLRVKTSYEQVTQITPNFFVAKLKKKKLSFGEDMHLKITK